MKKSVKIAATAITASAMLCLIIFPDRYTAAARDGLLLFATSVLPALFPFFFLTMLLTKMGTLTNFAKRADKLTSKMFRCGGVSAYVFLMSVLSGYPVGARLICELYSGGAIDKDEATRMSAFCSTSGPLFVAGTVGTAMFGNKACGFAMLASHIMSAVICGKIFCKYGDFRKNYVSYIANEKTDNILYESIYSSVISILCVGGFICVFYLLSNILSDFKILWVPEKLFGLILSFSPDGDIAAQGFVSGLIECTNGCRILGSVPSPLTASLACALISFGGISIIFQSLIYLTRAKVNVKIFLLSKTVQMILSFFICFGIVSLANIF